MMTMESMMTLMTSENGYEVTIELDPVPASRPKVSKWGVYYSETYKKWKSAAKAFFPNIFKQLKGPVGVSIEVVCKRPLKITNPIPTGDVDNFAKAVLDAVNDARLWADDKNVVYVQVHKRYAEKGEQARTITHLYAMPPMSSKFWKRFRRFWDLSIRFLKHAGSE